MLTTFARISTRSVRTNVPAFVQVLARSYSYNYKGVTLEGRPIYLDAQATTHLDPRVLDAMMPLWTEQFGNPHSSTHMYGWENDALVEKAREVSEITDYNSNSHRRVWLSSLELTPKKSFSPLVPLSPTILRLRVLRGSISRRSLTSSPRSW